MALTYRKVELRGWFVYDAVYHVVAAPIGPTAGFNMVTPFRLETPPSIVYEPHDFERSIILVDRGFAPVGKESRPFGIQTVTGFLRPPKQKKLFSPENQPDKNLWFYEDPAATSQSLPLVIEATGPRELGVWPMPSEGKITVRNDHLGYAITWFSLAIIAVIMFAFYRRSPSNRA